MHRQRHFSARQRLPRSPAAPGHAAGQCQPGRPSGRRDCRAGLIAGGAAPFRAAAQHRPETGRRRIHQSSRAEPRGRARRSHLPVPGALLRPGANSRPRRRRAGGASRRAAGDFHGRTRPATRPRLKPGRFLTGRPGRLGFRARERPSVSRGPTAKSMLRPAFLMTELIRPGPSRPTSPIWRISSRPATSQVTVSAAPDSARHAAR
jgi:hypothetical protein